ncbi:MAG TPA: hypothetical protein ENJ28_06310 [Gammaproteobacteria bacterium]|nr:hypothetical protein [Gammaproteobacteria bacterium]
MRQILLHIGLHKTATSYLQNVFRKNPCQFVQNELFPLVVYARDIGIARGAVNRPHPVINIPASFRKNIIVSQEGLGIVYFCGDSSGDLRLFQKTCAKLTKDIFPEAKIFLTLREPIKWIFSIYNQCIKEGAFYDFRGFIKKNHEILIDCLNIMDLLNIWGAYYDDFLVLPMEMLKDDFQLFFDILEDFAGFKLPVRKVAQEVLNPSISEIKLRLLRKFNEVIYLFKKYCAPSHRFPPQTDAAIHVIRFAMRMSLEHDHPILEEKLNFLKEYPSCNISEDHITADIKAKIKANLMDFFNVTQTFFGYDAHYLSTLG